MKNYAPFLTLQDIDVFQAQKKVIQGLSLEVRQGQHWAIIGPSGSGKTSLLEAIAGKRALRGGTIRHHYYDRYRAEVQPNDPYFNYKRLVAMVSHQHHFRNRYNMEEFYYQQRFNSADADEALSAGDYLKELDQEQGANDLAVHSGRGLLSREQIIEELHLTELLNRSLIKLSNGETRRLMFAEALLKHPRLLLLDAPFTGLDVDTRPYFQDLINRLLRRGITIIMTTSEKEIPEGITHVACLENGRLCGSYEREEFERRPGRKQQDDRVTGTLDLDLLKTLLKHPAASEKTFEYLVRMQDVNISYQGVQVLQGIDWEVKAGERWALSGHNGAGKSTLLSLINADNPQGYANELWLFDRKRGSGESIWDIKKKIGYMSPELHQYFKTADTCLEVVLSGLFDRLGLIKKCKPETVGLGRSWLQLLGLENQAGQPFKNSSLSVQRMVLLARSMIKCPPLLILDEPCQGMDQEQVGKIRQLIDAFCTLSGAALIYVSHYAEEIPGSVKQQLKLAGGKVLSKGPMLR